MNRFLTPFTGRHVSFDRAGRPILDMLQPLQYWSDRFGLREAPAGFRTNLCSTPRAPIAYWLFGGLFIAEAAIHDLGYTLHGDLTREEWDELFREMMDAPKVVEIQNDPPVWKRVAAYQAVRRFGQSSWEDETNIIQPDHIKALIVPVPRSVAVDQVREPEAP